MKSISIILFVTVNTIASQLILKYGITRIQDSADQHVQFLLKAVLSPYIWLAVSLQGVGYIAWWFVVAKMKLGIAFAISGAFFYILMAAASWFFYKESLNQFQWAGIILVSAGVILLTSSK